MAQKFIIEDNTITLGNVDYHRDMAIDASKVKSGGYWFISKDKVYFYGASMDFGRFTKEQLIEVKENGIMDKGLKKLDWYYHKSDLLIDAMEHGELI